MAHGQERSHEDRKRALAAAYIQVYEYQLGDLFYAIALTLKDRKPTMLLPVGWYYRTQVPGLPVVEGSIKGPFNTEEDAVSAAFIAEHLEELLQVIDKAE